MSTKRLVVKLTRMTSRPNPVCQCLLCGIEVKGNPSDTSEHFIQRTRGLRVIYQALNAKELWSSLVSELAEQVFCETCTQFLQETYQLLVNIEVLKVKLKTKVSDAKRKILLELPDNGKSRKSTNGHEFRNLLIEHVKKLDSSKSFPCADDDRNDELSDMDVDEIDVTSDRDDDRSENASDSKFIGRAENNIQSTSCLNPVTVIPFIHTPLLQKLVVKDSGRSEKESSDSDCEIVLEVPKVPKHPIVLPFPSCPQIQIQPKPQDKPLVQVRPVQVNHNLNEVTVVAPGGLVDKLVATGNQSGVVRFNCSHCRQSFLKSEFLSVHLERRHNITVSASEIVNKLLEQVSSNKRFKKIAPKSAQPKKQVKQEIKHIKIADILKRNPPPLTPEAEKELKRLVDLTYSWNPENRCRICCICHEKEVDLVKHSKNKHPDNKTFTCPKDDCTRTAWRPTEIRQHIKRVHGRAIVQEVRSDHELVLIPVQQPLDQGDNNSPVTYMPVYLQNPPVPTPEVAKKRAEVKVKPCKEDEDYEPKDSSCPVCSLRLPSITLAFHLLTHEDPTNKQFKCPTCDDKSFTLQQNLDTHLKFHKLESENPFLCCSCEIIYDSQKLLNRHFGLKHKDKILICQFEKNNRICNIKFVDEFQFKLHTMYHNGIYTCDFDSCDKRYKQKQRLLDHINCVHNGQKPYQCKENDCGQLFGSYAALTYHRQYVHFNKIRKKQKAYPWKGGSEMVICHICGKTMMKKYLSQHVKHGHKTTSKRDKTSKRDRTSASSLYPKVSKPKPLVSVKCGLCTMEVEPSNLKFHMESFHNDDNLDCIVCGRKNFTVLTLTEHIKENTCHLPVATTNPTGEQIPNKKKKTLRPFQKSDDAYKCRICKRSHTTVETLQEHFQKCHEGQRPFICSYSGCTKSALLRSEIRKHIDRVHGDGTLFPLRHICHICGQRRVSRNSLIDHLETHSDERQKLRIQCPHCPVTLHSKKSLKGHINCKHERKSEFKCTYCGKFYAYRGVLKTHMSRVHTGKYSCHICPMKRRSQEQLDVHFKLHKKNKEWFEPSEVQNNMISNANVQLPSSSSFPSSSVSSGSSNSSTVTDNLLTPAEAVFVGYTNPIVFNYNPPSLS